MTPSEAIDAAARKNGVTPEEVRAGIAEAIREGMKSAEPGAREFWAALGAAGEGITAESVISALTERYPGGEAR